MFIFLADSLIVEYIVSQFPQGWRILDGKVVGEHIPCYVCKKHQDKSEMAEVILTGGEKDITIYICPACKDKHWTKLGRFAEFLVQGENK